MKLINSKEFTWLLLQYYRPLQLAFASLTTDAHSLLSKYLVLHLFTPMFLRSHSTSIHVNLGLHFYLPPPGWPSSNFFTIFVPPILATCPVHSNLCTLITVTISGDFIINFSTYFYSPVTIFIHLPIRFSQDVPLPNH